MADTKDMFLETEISRPSEDISRLGKVKVDYSLYAGQKQRVGIFSGQRLVDYRKYQVDYKMYKSTNQECKSTNRAYNVCVCVQGF